MKSNLQEAARELRKLARNRLLAVSYAPEVNDELNRLGGNLVELFNVFRTGSITEERVDEFRYEGRLDNGKPVVVLATFYRQSRDNPKEQRSGVFVREIFCPTDLLASRAPDTQKVQVVRKRRGGHHGIE